MKKLFFALSTLSVISAQAADSLQHPLREIHCDVYEHKDETVETYEIVSSEYWTVQIDTETQYGFHGEGEFSFQKNDRRLGGLIQVRFRDNGEYEINYRPNKDQGKWVSSRGAGYPSQLHFGYDAPPYDGNFDSKAFRSIEIVCQLRKKAKK